MALSMERDTDTSPNVLQEPHSKKSLVASSLSSGFVKVHRSRRTLAKQHTGIEITERRITWRGEGQLVSRGGERIGI
jgi:hypothetical protein